MTPKLYKASDVCELVQVQPYVLRSWEKDFPGIGVQKSADSARLYRQSDVEQVLRIKKLVFGEGLTVSGARRRLEEEGAAAPKNGADGDDFADVMETLGADARTKIDRVREGLRAIHALLMSRPGAFVLEAVPMTDAKRTAKANGKPAAKLRAVANRGKVVKRAAAPKKKTSPGKRRRANA